MGSVVFERIRRSARVRAGVRVLVAALAVACTPPTAATAARALTRGRARGGAANGATQAAASSAAAPTVAAAPAAPQAAPTPRHTARTTGDVATSAPPCRGANLRPTSADLAAVDAATACLIDRARGAADLDALRANGSLQRVAARQSREMVLGDYFGDDSRAGQTPLQRIVATRYLRHAAAVSTAQNIGWGTGAQATPAAMVAAWMASPPHRAIVLTDEFRDIGVGATAAAPAALAAGEPGATYTVEFGVRR